jgi:hypothetical protein
VLLMSRSRLAPTPKRSIVRADPAIARRAGLGSGMCGNESCLVRGLRGARRDLAYVVVDGDAASNVIGGISAK